MKLSCVLFYWEINILKKIAVIFSVPKIAVKKFLSCKNASKQILTNNDYLGLGWILAHRRFKSYHRYLHFLE